jgi:hypothetical protein
MEKWCRPSSSRSCDRDGEARLGKPLTGLRIRAAVQGVLAARIDHLPAPRKRRCKPGRDRKSSLGATNVSCRKRKRAATTAVRLQEAEFIYEQPAFPEVVPSSTRLTQEVSYNSLLIERRKALRARRTGASALFHNQLEDHYSELALTTATVPTR